ncbi:MAG: hypothetical protein R3A48_12555 [Polyangiales bacterium]
MIFSYHWLCTLLGVDPGLDRVVERLTLSGLEVEHVSREGEHLRDVSVAKVLSTRPHPNSKNPLTLVTIDRGGGAEPSRSSAAPRTCPRPAASWPSPASEPGCSARTARPSPSRRARWRG